MIPIRFSIFDRMAMRIDISLAVALVVILSGGRGRSGNLVNRGQTNSATNLVADCQKLAEEGVKHGKEFWSSTDPLPPAIASLSPQRVHLSVREWATVVDIQVSGGFIYRGYLVVCASKDPNFVPATGRNWRITKIGPSAL
jgi:hypothetical protein